MERRGWWTTSTGACRTPRAGSRSTWPTRLDEQRDVRRRVRVRERLVCSARWATRSRCCRPGKPSGMYHREADQEDFLVLSGECIADHRGSGAAAARVGLRPLPPGTAHIFVGAGDGPCAIFMIGGRAQPRQRGVPARRGRAAPRRRAEGRHAALEGGLRAVPVLAPRPT